MIMLIWQKHIITQDNNVRNIKSNALFLGRTPVGLEDVSKYPNLFAELVKRGWNTDDLEKLAGRNLIRVFQMAEKVLIYWLINCLVFLRHIDSVLAM